MDKPGAAADLGGDEADEPLESKSLRACSIYGYVFALVSCADSNLSYILHENRLDPIAARPEYGEHRKPSQEPGYIVDQDVFISEDDRRPDDSVRQPGAHDGLFQKPLASEVGQGRVGGGVGNADVHNTAYTRVFRGLDECPGVLNGLIESDLAARKANPVGVVKDLCSLQVVDQCHWVVEAERGDADLLSEGVGAVGMSSEGLDRFSHRKKSLRDVFAGVSESPCDHTQASYFHYTGTPHIKLPGRKNSIIFDKGHGSLNHECRQSSP